MSFYAPDHWMLKLHFRDKTLKLYRVPLHPLEYMCFTKFSDVSTSSCLPGVINMMPPRQRTNLIICGMHR